MPGNNPWLAHVKKVKAKHPKLMLKDVLKKAAATYKKKTTAAPNKTK
jgi:hypothetical protein